MRDQPSPGDGDPVRVAHTQEQISVLMGLLGAGEKAQPEEDEQDHDQGGDEDRYGTSADPVS